MKTFKFSFLLILALAVSLQSCNTTKGIKTAELEGKWELKTFGGKDVKASFEGKIPTLNLDFADHRATGSGGCNTFTGQFTFDKDQFSAPNLASTMMACMEANKEFEYLKALAGPLNVSIVNNDLVLTGVGTQSLVFERAKALTAEDLSGLWELAVLQGATANVDFVGNPPTLEFDFAEGRLGGNGGCNRYNGVFELNGNSLKIGSLMSTKMACDNLKGESKYMQLLSDGTVDVELEGDRLTFKRDGLHIATYVKK